MSGLVPVSEYRYLAAAESSHNFCQNVLDVQSIRLDQEKKETERVAIYQREKLQQTAHYGRLSDIWTFAQKVATTLVSSNLVRIGMETVASGGNVVSGSVFIVGGFVHIANTCFAQHGVWEWAAKKLALTKESQKLATLFPAFASGVLLFTHPIQSSGEIFSEALPFLETVTSLGQGYTLTMQKMTDADLHQLKANLTALRKESQVIQQSVKQLATALKTDAMHNQQWIALVTQSAILRR